MPWYLTSVWCNPCNFRLYTFMWRQLCSKESWQTRLGGWGSSQKSRGVNILSIPLSPNLTPLVLTWGTKKKKKTEKQDGEGSVTSSLADPQQAAAPPKRRCYSACHWEGLLACCTLQFWNAFSCWIFLLQLEIFCSSLSQELSFPCPASVGCEKPWMAPTMIRRNISYSITNDGRVFFPSCL